LLVLVVLVWFLNRWARATRTAPGRGLCYAAVRAYGYRFRQWPSGRVAGLRRFLLLSLTRLPVSNWCGGYGMSAV